ncbi:MAG: hypothetical protein ACRD68_18725, partial [Pyrinomonadaceae bacterium]
AHSAVAQEIRIGGVSISIPKRAKTPKAEKPAARVEPPRETPAAGSEETKTTSAARTASAAASRAPAAQSDVWLEVVVDDINKKKAEVEGYDPAEDNRAFAVGTPYWLGFAVSPRAREGYFKQVKATEARRAALNTAFDALAAAAAKKLPLYKPEATIFALRNAAAEQMIVRSLKNAATLKVRKIGVKEANWLIEKNEFGIPLNRYRHGYIWGRDTGDDHPYCHLYTVYIQQDYAGGGTYGRTFANFSDDQVVGCP